MNIIGWIGSIMLAICGVPQLIKTRRDGHAEGISLPFLGLWFGGELLTLGYVAPSLDWPLMANYGANVILVGIIGYYKLWPRHSNKNKLTTAEKDIILRQLSRNV